MRERLMRWWKGLWPAAQAEPDPAIHEILIRQQVVQAKLDRLARQRRIRAELRTRTRGVDRDH